MENFSLLRIFSCYTFKISYRCTKIHRKICRIDPSNKTSEITVKSSRRRYIKDPFRTATRTHVQACCDYCPRSYFQSSSPNNTPFPIYNSTPFPVEQENHLPAGGFAERCRTHRRWRGRKAREKTRRKYRGGLVVCAGRTREQKITERTIWEITEAPVLVSNRLNPAAGRIPCCLSPSTFPRRLAFSFSLGPARTHPPTPPHRTTWPFCIFSSAFCVLPRAPRATNLA